MSFSLEVAKFAKGTDLKIQRIRRGVTIKLFNAVVMDTPVLSGRLRGNWRFSESTPLTAELNREDKTGQIVMREVEAGTLASTGDVSLYLTNNLPYAARIEFDGWSHTKAPDGMVRRNVVRFNRLITIENQKSR